MLSRALAMEIFPIPDVLPNEDLWTALHADHLAMQTRMIPQIVLNYRIHDGNSMARTEGFAAMTQKRHQRFIAYDLFLRKVEDRLPEQGRRLLEALAKGEELRFGRHPWRLLVHKALPLKERLRMMAYASPGLHWLRMRFYRLFSGW